MNTVPKISRPGRPQVIRILQVCLLLLVLSATGVLTGFAQVGWKGSRVGPAKKDLNAVYFADSKRGWIGGDDGFVSNTDDGGQSWVQQSLSTKKPVSDIYFPGNDTGK